MRFGFAIATLVLSGVLLLLGIGQRTFLAGPAEIVYSLDAASGSEYAVIPAVEFESVPGQANLVTQGDDTFVAIGSAIDVAAWVEPFTHETVIADPIEKSLTVSQVTAAGDLSDEALEALTPNGSDLWVTEHTGEVSLPISLRAEQAVLVQSSEGGGIAVHWVQDNRTPLAGPFLVAGGALALVGLILYLFAVDHDRRRLGPRRGRRGPLLGIRDSLRGRRRHGRGSDAGAMTGSAAEAPGDGRLRRRASRNVVLPALGVVAMLALSGCSPSYWPDFSDKPDEQVLNGGVMNAAPVPVTEAQLDRIVSEVSVVATEADGALDAALLEVRFSGDALAQRAANYKIRAQVPDYEVTLPRITDTQLDYELVQSTVDWPRTMFVTVASAVPGAEAEAEAVEAEASDGEGEEAVEAPKSPQLAMVLTQAGPHENYRVSRLLALRGGIEMPAAAPAEEGTALLADDLQSLALMPGEVGPAYAAALQGERDTEQADLFDFEGDTIMANMGAAWVEKAREAEASNDEPVNYSVTALQGEAPITSLSTGVGGGLVATTVVETRTESQSESRQPAALGAVAALSGLEGRQERLVSTVAHQLLFFVPSAASGEKIRLLGYTTELVGASN